jgi:uncharacterized protein (TIGR02757 family)
VITKIELEKLTKKYEVKEFILNDPIQFPHRFKNSANVAEDVEIAAFVASLFSYGNRKVFIKKLDELFTVMKNQPLNFVLNFEPESLMGMNYRFAKDIDLIEVFLILQRLYSKDKDASGLKALFEYGYSQDNTIRTMLKVAVDYFYSKVGKNGQNEVKAGFYHLIPDPKNNGAMKRMNMFLRWMVRKPPVDLGLWDFIPTSELLIPLDVHVARLSREMGLLRRNTNDFKAVIELTDNLKKFDKKDPVKFDFAIFGLGIDK